MSPSSEPYIPTAEDWRDRSDQALAFALEVAAATHAHGDAKTSSIALGIASKLIEAAAPIIGSAIGGAPGALTGAAIAHIAAQLGNHSARALDTLSADEQKLIADAITIGAAAVSQKLGH